MERDEYPLAGVESSWLRERQLQATSLLLGATIAIGDPQWQEASLLPGWTRAHVATHLSRGAVALARVGRHLLRNAPEPVYVADDPLEIERGSERNGLALQIDLDTSAGQLNQTLDALTAEQWREQVRVGEHLMPARLLPAARLNEVTLHHIDLDIGYACAAVDDDIAGWLVEWNLSPFGGLPHAAQFRVVTDDGLRLGHGERELTGSRQAVLARLTGRPLNPRGTGSAQS